jgi:hypothetical protein
MITETTIEIVDSKVYKDKLRNETNYIPGFMRVLAATRLARTAVKAKFKYRKNGLIISRRNSVELIAHSGWLLIIIYLIP